MPKSLVATGKGWIGLSRESKDEELVFEARKQRSQDPNKWVWSKQSFRITVIGAAALQCPWSNKRP